MSPVGLRGTRKAVPRLFDKLQIGDRWDEVSFGRFLEELADGFPTDLPIIDREFIDVHPDELIGQRRVQVAGMSQTVGDGRGAVGKPVGNAFAEDGTELGLDFHRDVPADDIAAERQGELAGAFPPFTEVEDIDETFFGVRELAFVDDEPDFRLTRMDGLKNFVKGDDDMGKVGSEKELSREVGAGHFAGNGNGFALEPSFAFLVVGGGGGTGFGDKHGTVTVAHAGPAGEERVFVEDMSEGVNGNGGDVELSAGGAFVQGLDVLKNVFEAVAMQVDEVFRHGIEHEGVVRIGGVAKGESLRHGRKL